MHLKPSRKKREKSVPIRLRWVILCLLMIYGLYFINAKFNIITTLSETYRSMDHNNKPTTVHFQSYQDNKSDRTINQKKVVSYWVNSGIYSKKSDETKFLESIGEHKKMILEPIDGQAQFFYKFGPFEHIKETRGLSLSLSNHNIYHNINLERN